MSFQRRIYEQNLKTESHLGPEYKYLGKDKKFGREFYEKDGQLHVTRGTSKFVQNLGSTSVKANAKMIKGLIKDHVELEEAIKVGDTVHLGHGTKGGTGVVGKVTKIQGSTVHIKNDNGDTFKGPLNRATVRESVENLDELKTSTLRSYVKKAQDDNQKRAMRQVDMYTTNPLPKKEFNKLRKRNRGVARAKERLGESPEHLDEVSPPGFEGTVKAMKKRHSDKIDNPWALSWWMKNKGYKSHKKADGTDKKEK